MSKRVLVYAMAVLAGGLALAAGTASAATKKVVHTTTQRHFGTRTVRTQTHTTTPHHNTVQFRGRHTTTTKVTHQNKPTFHKHFGPGPGSHPITSNPKIAHVPFKPGPVKPGPVVNKKLTFPIIKLGNNKVWPIWKGPKKKIWVGGHWKFFVPFSAIHVVLISGHYYWPDAYINVGRPYCEGVTADGCQLNWQFVNFEDGGGAWQCVQYCQRPDAPPPPQAVALVPPPPLPPSGACEVTIFSEPNFTGQDATTGDEQPALSQSGWQNAIASIQVKSGVWDFFADENYGGNNMRLRPGSYQELGPDWTRKINSFMCVMTAVPQ